MNLKLLVAASKNYVTELLAEKLPAYMYFHNVEHTMRVVHAVIEIGRHSKIGEKEILILQMAAWFHDTGYTLEYHGHENRSITIATSFLTEHNCDEKIIDKVTACIAATKVPQLPQNMMERVICDADMYHLANVAYWELSLNLKKEWEMVLGEKHTAREWLQSSIHFLAAHKYFTDYGQTVLQQQKLSNIDELLKRL